MRKKILLTVNLPQLQVNQNNSAVYNYLRHLSSVCASENLEVGLFPEPFESVPYGTDSHQNKGVFSILKKYLPPTLKKAYSDWNLFKEQRVFQNEIEELSNNYDLVLEFYTYGSSLYKNVIDVGKKYAMIFDAPVYYQSQEVTSSHSLFATKVLSNQKKSVQSAEFIICYSDAVASYLVNRFKISEEKIFVFPCYIPNRVNRSRTLQNAHYIGFIGSFLKWHNVKLLVKSFELAADKLPNSAKLVLIGKGQEWVQVKQMVDRSPVRDRILMPGYLTNEELNEWKQNIRIGVMPGSNWYGSPLKLFEYAFAGIPFVAPKTPTIQYIFREGQDALYIDEKSKLDSLASQMVKLYLDIDLQRRINQSALERITESFPEKKLSAFLENVK